jgi:hypothetical protein
MDNDGIIAYQIVYVIINLVRETTWNSNASFFISTGYEHEI